MSARSKGVASSRYSVTDPTTSVVLCDLLLFCKKRLDEHSMMDLLKVIPLDEEKEDLEQTSAALITEYLKQIINYLVKQKVRMMDKFEQFVKPEDDYMNEYEGMLQKLEAECRTHIRIEQQLKICAETAQEQLELTQRDLALCESSKALLEQSLQSMMKTQEELITLNKERDNRIDTLKARIKELEQEQVENLSQLQVRQQQQLQQHSSLKRLPMQSTHVESTDKLVSIHLSGGANTAAAVAAANLLQPTKGITRIHRSVSTVIPTMEEQQRQQFTQREVMRQIESNISENDHRQSQQRLGTAKWSQQNTNSITTNNNHNSVTKTIIKQSNHQSYSSTYSQDALANLLSSSNNHGGQGQVIVPIKQINGIVQQSKTINVGDKKYLFDKGENTASNAKNLHASHGMINGNSNTSNNVINNSGRIKAPANSAYNSVNSNAMNVNLPSQNQLQASGSMILKTIYQQQPPLQQQQQAQQPQNLSILARFQSRINAIPQQIQQQIPASLAQNSNNLSQQYSQRSLSRTKSRLKFKEYESKDGVHSQSVEVIRQNALSSNKSNYGVK